MTGPTRPWLVVLIVGITVLLFATPVAGDTGTGESVSIADKGSIATASTSTANITIKIDNPGPTPDSYAEVIPVNETVRRNQGNKTGSKVTYTGLSPGTYNFSVHYRLPKDAPSAWWGNLSVTVNAGDEKTVTFTRYTPYVNNTIVLPDAPRDAADDPRYHYLDSDALNLTAVVHNPDNPSGHPEVQAVSVTFRPKRPTASGSGFPAGRSNVPITAGETKRLVFEGDILDLTAGRHYELGFKLTADYGDTSRLSSQTIPSGTDLIQQFWIHDRMLDVRNHNWAYNGSLARGSLHGDWLTDRGLDGTGTTIALLIEGIDTSNPAVNPVYEDGVSWETGKFNVVARHNPGLGGIEDDPGDDSNYHGWEVASSVWQFAPNASYIVVDISDEVDLCEDEQNCGINWLINNRNPDLVVTSTVRSGNAPLLKSPEELAENYAKLVDADTTAVAGAGNSGGEDDHGYPQSPSTGVGVLSISSTTRDRSICRGSSPGNSTILNRPNDPEKPDFAAPGCDVMNLGAPLGASGSSFAGPYATGVIALLTQRAHNHGKTARDVRTAIGQTAIPTTTWNGTVDADDNGSTNDDDIDGVGGIRPTGAYYELLADDGYPNANVTIQQVDTSTASVTFKVTLNNTGADAGAGSGVYLAVEAGRFVTVNPGEFRSATNVTTSGAGVRAYELYTPAGNVTSGNITIEVLEGSSIDLKYRGWLFDPHDAVYNPHQGRYNRYVARYPEEARYTFTGSRWVLDSSGDRLVEGERPPGTSNSTPYNRHTGDEDFTIHNYDVYTETIEVSPKSPRTTITETNVSDASPGVVHIEWKGSDPDGSVARYEYRVDGGEWITVERTTLDLNLSRGSHTIDVRAVDAAGRIGAPASTTAALGEPVANFTLSQPEPLVGEQLILNASTSSTPAPSITEYAWNVDGDGSYELTGKTVETAFPEVTDRTVTLRITDSRNVTAAARTTISTDTTLIVSNESDGDYRTIGAAIDRIPNNSAATGPSYTIRVREGNYRETVTLNKNVTLRAVGEVVLNGSTLSQYATAITLPAGSSVAPTIDGVRIVSYRRGILAKKVSGDWTVANATIEARTGVLATHATGDWRIVDSTFTNNAYGGVRAAETTGAWRIVSSRFTGNGAGATLSFVAGGVIAPRSSGDWTIADSVIVDNVGQVGVFAYNSSGAWTIRNASIRNNGCIGVGASRTSGDWTIRRSTVTNHTSRCGIILRQVDVRARNATGAPEITHTRIGAATPCEDCPPPIGLDAKGAMPAVNATMNWWNASSGPSGIDSGDGRPVRGNALVRPFYTDRDLSTLSTTDPDPTTPPSVSEFNVTVPETGTINVTVGATEPLAGINVSLVRNGILESRVRRVAFVQTGTDPYAYVGTLKRPTGNYTVRLHTIRDASWNVVQVGGTRTVNMTGNIPPEADFSPPNHLDAGEQFSLFGDTYSRDRDGHIDTYRWHIESIGTISGEWVWISSGFGSPGRYNITLTVIDNDGANDSVTKSVPVGPPSDFSVTSLDDPVSVPRGATLTVTATLSNSGYLSEATQTVEFRLDTDHNGTADPDEVQTTKQVTLSNGESRTVQFKVPTDALDTTTYRAGVFTANDSRAATVDVSAYETRTLFQNDTVEYGTTTLSVAYANYTDGPYYVVVHERLSDGSLSTPVANSSQLSAGGHRDVTIDLARTASSGDGLDAITENTTLVAIIHAVDAGGIGDPITRDGNVINDSAGITVPPPLVVANDSSGDYRSIQAAVDNASAIDRVVVRPGTYRETVTIDTGLTLVAPEGAILNGSGFSGSPSGIKIPENSGADPTINGFTITGYGVGVNARRSGGAWTIRNVTIVNNSGHGVNAYAEQGAWSIWNSTISYNGGDGVYAVFSHWGSDADPWIIRWSSITNNSGYGVNAGSSQVEGNATYNWWGQPSGPTSDQTTGNIDDSHPLDAPPGSGSGTNETTCIGDSVSGSDGKIGLTEIQEAINWWAEDTEVPNTGGETISLTKIQSLINAWAEDTTVSCS